MIGVPLRFPMDVRNYGGESAADVLTRLVGGQCNRRGGGVFHIARVKGNGPGTG